MTSGGGATTGCAYCGTIFKIMPNGTGYTNLRNFGNDTFGNEPYSSLFYDSTNSFLYGTASYGGVIDQGTVFKIKTDGTGQTVLHDFYYSSAFQPYGSLISDGTFLYGMTLYGGTGSGTSVNCSPPNAEGCGVMYKVKPNGTGYDSVMNFKSQVNGNFPFGSVLFDGTFLYGMTAGGGVYDHGTIVKVKPDGTGATVLLNFNDTNGGGPRGSLIIDGTFLYGMAIGGGTSNDGVVFKIKPDGTGDTVLLNFNGTNGKNPYGSLVSDGTFLYGMTELGGANNMGVIFKIKPDGTGATVLLNFNDTNGSNPYGSLIYKGGCLFGMTANGGANGLGTVFSYGPSLNGIKKFAGNEQLKIYPNPANTILNVDLGIKDAEIKITDVLGNEVIGTTQKQIDVSNLQSGIYFVQAKTNEGVLSKKIIIQK